VTAGWSPGLPLAVLGLAFNAPAVAVVAVAVVVIVVVLATYVLVARTNIAPRVKIRDKTTIEFERLTSSDEGASPPAGTTDVTPD